MSSKLAQIEQTSKGRVDVEVIGHSNRGRELYAARVGTGAARGRFSPKDGHLYVVGLDGWRVDNLRQFRAINAFSERPDRKLTVVFGCGGDRDKGKRPLMGEVAGRDSDVSIVTSDNPRTEDPHAIIAQIMAGVQKRMLQWRFGRRRCPSCGRAIARKDLAAHVAKELETLSRMREQWRAWESAAASLDAQIYDAVRERFPDSGQVELELKGKSQPTEVVVLTSGSARRVG